MTPAWTYADDVNPNLICCICQSAFMDPVTLSGCGHTFCRDCFVQTLHYSHADHLWHGQCPLDRHPIQLKRLEDLQQAALLVQNMVNELHVLCPNRPDCPALLQRQLIACHVDQECLYQKKRCLFAACGQSIVRKEWQAHVDACPWRTECCPLCLAEHRPSDKSNHDCCPLRSSCRFCRQEIVGAEALAKHLTVCDQVHERCCHSDLGCEWIRARLNRKKHEEGCVYGQVHGMQDVIRHLRSENEALQQRLTVVESLAHDQWLSVAAAGSQHAAEDEHHLNVIRFEQDRMKVDLDMLKSTVRSLDMKLSLALANDSIHMRQEFQFLRVLVQQLNSVVSLSNESGRGAVVNADTRRTVEGRGRSDSRSRGSSERGHMKL